MSSDFKAIIREGSSRYEDWLNVFGGNEAPIQSPIPIWTSAAEIGDGLFYLIDLGELTGEQKQRLISHLSTKHKMGEQEVEQILNIEGCPILDQDVTIAIHNPQKWLC